MGSISLTTQAISHGIQGILFSTQQEAVHLRATELHFRVELHPGHFR